MFAQTFQKQCIVQCQKKSSVSTHYALEASRPAGLDEHSGAPIDKAAVASEILRWKKSMAWRRLCICGLHAE